ncbi:restriction endonuclease subunit S [Rathayibacter iranicus]|uniref:Restriction endonuclease subunit S n=2 Tax=Rathayibacter iranicus TaxID=59737 RepID=A0AAD1AIQ9_9MICO|nr:restriction endonuclease subunit S [Rathayibacter iranicus]AZZ57191.1 restriction endonuclease subunit S [Rathayibacter iranicus]MWV29827.1 restriction endonuclease subunit S [Rathayibacter iranicus NCPPB 2253 = VKM Ac-1602]PPI41216.1 hypothetical protein C5E09_14785 [Rathayibacter iranicus]PPI57462.1 hypothetical protein C5E08_15675 [Rathayibacter iranicus]PPI68327.1 hypothetical protein C5E01_14725 [Rathayibacter iranicus]
MKSARLGDVALIQRQSVDPSKIDPNTIYIGLEHLERGGRIIGHDTVGNAELASSKFIFSARHLLYSKLRPNLGKISRPNFSGVCSTDILPVLPGSQLNRDYLAHYLAQPSMVNFASSRAAGANLPRLSPATLDEFEIPLPPLEEQRRIAAILDHTDALRAKRRQVLTHLDSLAHALFNEALKASTACDTALGDVARFAGGASLPPGEPFAGQPGGTLLMKVSDMNSSGNERTILKTALWTDRAVPASSTVEAGAVVLPKRGASIATNKKRVVTRRTTLDPNLMGVTPINDRLTSDYIFAWLNAFDLASITSGSSVPQLNKQDLAPLLFPLPSRADQLQFSARIGPVELARTRSQLSLAIADKLFASLQKRAFRGEI